MAADSYVQAGLDAGLSPDLANYMPRFVQVESGGNPSAQTGSYSGLLQMGPDEAQRYGGNGLDAGAKMYADRANWFQGKFGRAPSPTELYLTNQQGEGGITQHLSNPDAPAWQNMLATGEGQKKGAGWARQAIWGNVPDDMKPMFGSVDNITSKQFVNDIWGHKIERTPINPSTAMAYNGSGSDQSQSPIHQALAKQMNGAPSMADNGILSAVQNYGPGALFGAGQPDFNAATGLMGLGAGLTVAGGDAKGGSGMMNAAMLPMFKQRYSVVSDKYGNQRVFDLHRGGFVSSPFDGASGSGQEQPATQQGGSTAAPPAVPGINLPDGSQFTPNFGGLPGQPGPVLDIEQRKKLIENAPKEMEGYTALDNAGQNMKVKTQEMRQLMQDPHFNAGSELADRWGDLKANISTVLGHELPGVSQNQTFDKNSTQAMTQWLTSQPGVTRVAQPEIALGHLANAGRDKTAATNASILHDYDAQADYAHSLHQLADAYYQKYGYLGPGFQSDLVRLQDHFRQSGMQGGLTTVQPGQVPSSGGAPNTQRPPLSSFSK